MTSWKNLYGPDEMLFWYHRLQGTNDNILVFWLYVNLIDICNMKPKLFLSLLFVLFGSCSWLGTYCVNFNLGIEYMYEEKDICKVWTHLSIQQYSI
jgi:hypothetical protein